MYFLPPGSFGQKLCFFSQQYFEEKRHKSCIFWYKLYNAQNNNNLEIMISWCPATETAKHKILWQMANKGMKTHAI